MHSKYLPFFKFFKPVLFAATSAKARKRTTKDFIFAALSKQSENIGLSKTTEGEAP